MPIEVLYIFMAIFLVSFAYHVVRSSAAEPRTRRIMFSLVFLMLSLLYNGIYQATKEQQILYREFAPTRNAYVGYGKMANGERKEDIDFGKITRQVCSFQNRREDVNITKEMGEFYPDGAIIKRTVYNPYYMMIYNPIPDKYEVESIPEKSH